MQSSLGVTKETSNIEKYRRARMQDETKRFQEDFYKHLKRVLDSLESKSRVFYQIDSDMIQHTVTIRLGCTLGLDDLPSEIRNEIKARESEEIAKEHGEIAVTYEGTMPEKPTKTLEERIKEMEDARPEPKKTTDILSKKLDSLGEEPKKKEVDKQ
jgi:hypothetical protein